MLYNSISKHRSNNLKKIKAQKAVDARKKILEEVNRIAFFNELFEDKFIPKKDDRAQEGLLIIIVVLAIVIGLVVFL